jgi:hypothetical protein
MSTWYVGHYLAYCTSPGWWMMSVEHSVEWVAGETEVLGENLPQCCFVHHNYAGLLLQNCTQQLFIAGYIYICIQEALDSNLSLQWLIPWLSSVSRDWYDGTIRNRPWPFLTYSLFIHHTASCLHFHQSCIASLVQTPSSNLTVNDSAESCSKHSIKMYSTS